MSDVPEILGVHGKASVVRLPGRRFPGVWLPADTLYTWIDAIQGDGAEGAAEVSDELLEVLGAYVREVKERGEPLPFTWPRT